MTPINPSAPAIANGAQNALDKLNAPGAKPAGKNGLGSLTQADFLRLLTTQLTIQDPLEPVNNEQMLAQMAQFSSLAATTRSSSTLESIAAKLDDLIAAQKAATQASQAALAAVTATSQAPDPGA